MIIQGISKATIRTRSIQHHTGKGMMKMAGHTNERYNTISAALNIIDPEGACVPGSIEHNWATEMILSWMAEMEPDAVLKKSEASKDFFRFKAPTWQ